MNPKAFEARMRVREAYHNLRVLDGLWIVLRVDGRGFHRYTNQCDKPFDTGFHGKMCLTTQYLVNEFNAIYAFTESDEISLVLPPRTDIFDREVEKLVSVSAGEASAHFGACFDSRIWLGTSLDDVLDYFAWRQHDAFRCCVSGYAYWALREQGRNARQASAMLQGISSNDRQDAYYVTTGKNINDVPAWQRRGTGVYWKTYEKLGWNPKIGEAVTAKRRGIKEDNDLPMKEDYRWWLTSLLTT